MHFKDGNYLIKDTGQTFKKQELMALIEKQAYIFSPNVLLRPIYQDYLLPTVAYVGGPAEIAYFAQMKGIYENFNIPMPIIYPRKSITIVERKIDKFFKKNHLEIQDMWQNIDGTIKKITSEQIPQNINEVINQTISNLEKDFNSIKNELTAFDKALEHSVDTSLGKINQQFKFLEKKILKASKNKNDTIIQQINKAKNNLYPENSLQERVLNIVPFLIKYNFRFIELVYNTIEINNYDHQVILFELN